MLRLVALLTVAFVLFPGAAPVAADPKDVVENLLSQVGKVAQVQLTKQIQKRLKKLGCYPGKIDGQWNSETKQAVKLALGKKTSTKKPTLKMLKRLNKTKKTACAQKKAATGAQPPKAKTKSKAAGKEKKGTQKAKKSSGGNRAPASDTTSGDTDSGGLPAGRTRSLSGELTPRSATLGHDICQQLTICTPVPVYYGTNRARNDSWEDGALKRIAYGWSRTYDLELGRAIVTVPRTTRQVGEINRPSWFDRWFGGTPPEGDPAQHFVILADGFKVFSRRTDFLAEVRTAMQNAASYAGHVFIFVHGYNTSFDDALYRTAQISYDLGEADAQGRRPFGTAFLYSWPSAGETKDYPYDTESAYRSVQYLRDFIKMVAKDTGAQNVHLIAHSMGNVPMLNAINEIARDADAPANINQIILAAPDVDARDFENLAAKVKQTARGVTLYASSNDHAMDFSRQVHKGRPRAGDVPEHGPVIVEGIDTMDVSSLSTSYFSIGHNHYVEHEELRDDISKLLRQGLRPPNVRDDRHRPAGDADGRYWQSDP